MRTYPPDAPDAEDNWPRRGAGERAGGGEGARAVILLVDDDDSVRVLLAHMLRRAGFQVLEATDGVDALERVVAGGVYFDLVLTDVSMPRMGGDELVRCISRERPGVPALYMSGSNFGARLAEGAEFMSKPLSSVDLVCRIERLLGLD